jgi:hypothetical protein
MAGMMAGEATGIRLSDTGCCNRSEPAVPCVKSALSSPGEMRPRPSWSPSAPPETPFCVRKASRQGNRGSVVRAYAAADPMGMGICTVGRCPAPPEN